MMFEVQDLRVASPATVSRCGMVYLEPVQLGWEPLIDTWFERMEEEIPEPHLSTLVGHVRAVCQTMLKVIRKKCKEVVPSVDANLIQSCLRLLHTFLGEKGLDLKKASLPNPVKAVSTYMTFCIVWSLGANLQDASREVFAKELQACLKPRFPELPDGDVYSYGIDTELHKLENWEEQIPSFTYDPNVSFFEILVPTSDTVKYKFLLHTLLGAGHNVLITGETGVGKSVVTKDFLATAPDHIVSACVNFSLRPPQRTCRTPSRATSRPRERPSWDHQEERR
jgi:dynein heavy chain